jgi:hypoxanthine phosphoribosyltransferase
MNIGFYRILNKRNIRQISGHLSKLNYVIVDDSLDTGKTISTVINYLHEIHKREKPKIMIAVITQMFDDSSPAADCAVFKNTNFSFPWSIDSKEYDKFIDFCQSRNIS